MPSNLRVTFPSNQRLRVTFSSDQVYLSTSWWRVVMDTIPSIDSFYYGISCSIFSSVKAISCWINAFLDNRELMWWWYVVCTRKYALIIGLDMIILMLYYVGPRIALCWYWLASMHYCLEIALFWAIYRMQFNQSSCEISVLIRALKRWVCSTPVTLWYLLALPTLWTDLHQVKST